MSKLVCDFNYGVERSRGEAHEFRFCYELVYSVIYSRSLLKIVATFSLFAFFV